MNALIGTALIVVRHETGILGNRDAKAVIVHEVNIEYSTLGSHWQSSRLLESTFVWLGKHVHDVMASPS